MNYEETEIDPVTGQLRTIPLQQNSLVQSPLNRKLLYTKSEIDAMFAQISSSGGTTDVGITNYKTNDIDSGTTSYFGKTTTDGAWAIIKLTGTVVSYATVTNNPATTVYTTAWTNRATLTYGRYDEAF